MGTAEDETSVFEEYRDRVDRPLARLFREYGSPEIHWLIVGMVANVLARASSLLPPVVLGVAIDAVFLDRTGYSLLFLPDRFVPAGETAQFWFSVQLIVAAFVATAVLTWVYGVAANNFAHGVMHAVRVDSFEKMQSLDMWFFDGKQTGEVMSVLNNDTTNLERFLDNALQNSVRLGVMVIGIAVVLFSENAQLAALTLVAVPLMVGFTWWFMRAVEPRYTSQRESVGDLNTRLENALGGMQLIKTSGTESYESDRVRDASYSYFQDTMAVLKLNYLYRPGMELFAGLAFATTFVVGGLWLTTGTAPGPLTGTLSEGQFVTFLFLTQRFTAPLAEVSNIVDSYENAKASSERVFGLQDVPRRITDREDAVALDDPDGRVVYDDVSFGYEDGDPGAPDTGEASSDGAWADGGSPGTVDADGTGGVDETSGTTETDEPEEWVLESVDFTAEPGDTVAFVGPTGAGKSTLVKLLLRLYDTDTGAIRIDGHDVRDVETASLRSSIGYVSQDTFLFDGSVADNVRYGEFDADREAVVAACEAAEADEFVRNLPDGYDTRIGERGVKLSGGQRQRLSIARTVLQDPEILVLDEATSAVDTETELLIQRSLDRLAADRTTFVIAHRLSTIRDADTVLVLEDGQIVERGTHDDLLAEDGLYAKLWGVQAGEIESLPSEFLDRARERRAETLSDDD
ncbi:ABC transporter ATP-binding protein [Halobaculum sp. MBLA0147]|uniref:ABC transporter ATP-binding protein n=1 Tax=Halobaculum sp. MBLA0147 TaxID=3079934 RepID=UPI003526AC52